MTWQSEVRAWAMAAAVFFCLGSIGYRVITAPKIPDLAPTVAKVNAEIDEAHRLTLEAGLTAKEAREASAKELAYLDQWNKQVSASIGSFQGVMLQTRQTITASQGTLQAATGAINTANAQLTHVGPLLDTTRATVASIPPAIKHITKDVDDSTDALSAFIRSPQLTATVDNVKGVTGSWAAISLDAQKISDKETKEFLKPVKWWQWPIKRASQFIDIAAAVARNVP